MKIFHITNYRDRCGIADYAEHLMKALEKCGVESIPLPIRWSEHKYMQRIDIAKLYEQLADSVPTGSVVHVQHEYSFFAGAYGTFRSLQIFGALLERLAQRNVRVAVTFHSVPPEFVRLNLRNLIQKRRQARLTAVWRKKILPWFKAGRCIAICHNKHTQLALVKSRIPRKAVRVLYFPCGEDADVPQSGPRAVSPSAGAKAALGIGGDRTVLTCFGFISAYKGINTISAALKYLPGKFVFLLAGDRHPQSNDRSLETMLKYSKREDWIRSAPEDTRRIIVTGYLEREKVSAVWDATDIALCCYDDLATFSMSAALPEALSSGKPVVASQIPAFREVNEMGNCLAMVAPGSPRELALAIERLSGNDAEKGRLVANSMAYARTYTWKKFAEETAAIYEELASGNSASRGSSASR